ncbi:X antigen family member 1-like isoform X1 [Homo sapiens]|nr:X antigen family member 1-like isoform X1 [Homo sapiens]
MRCHAHGPSCLVTAITREEGGPRSGGAQAKLGCCWGYPSPRSTWNPDRRFWTSQTGPGEGRHERHTQTQNHTASPRSPVMESPKKKNQQLKVGILHLGSRQKKIRIQLRSQCATWKVICKSCISQTPGINLDLGSGVKVKIIPKEEHCKMPEAGEEQPQV